MNKQLLAKLLKHNADAGVGSGSHQEHATDPGATDEVQATDPVPADAFEAPKSQGELDSLINKAVQAALKNNDAKHEKALEQAVQQALEKEKDYSKLSQDERHKKELEDERNKLERDKAAFARQQLVLQVKEDLVSKSLPASLAEVFALHGEADEALKAVNAFEKVFNEAVAEQVKSTLRQSAPAQTGNGVAKNNFGASVAGEAIITGEKLF